MNKYRKACDAAYKARGKAAAPIWRECERDNARFSEGMARVSIEVREAYHAALSRVAEAEHNAISAGKAWRSAIGLLIWN